MNTDIHYWVGLVWNIYFLYALLIILISMFIVSVRYRFLINYFNGNISLKGSFFVVSATQFLSYLSPFKIGTFILKPFITSFFSRTPIKKSLFVSFFEQAFEVMWQIALLPVLLIILGERFLFNKVSYQIAIVALFIVFFIAVLFRYKQAIDFLWKLKIFVPKILKKAIKRLNVSKESANQIMEKVLSSLSDWKVLAVVSLITAVLILFSPLVVSVIALSLSYNLTYFAAFSTYWVSLIIGRLSGIPGGAASREVVMIGMLVAFKVAAVDAVKIALLARLSSLIPLFFIGGPLTLYLSTKVSFKKLLNKKEAL